MEILLISEGGFSDGASAQELQYFFSIQNIDLTDDTADFAGDFDAVIVEMTGVSATGVARLRSNWARLSKGPVICIASKASRLEMVQADAMGPSLIFERSLPFTDLVKAIRKHVAPDLTAGLQGRVPAAVTAAFEYGNAILENLCLAAAIPTDFPAEALAAGSRTIDAVIEANGLENWLIAVQSHHSATFSHSLAVSGIAGALAARLGWSQQARRLLVAGGLVHDLGKVRIPLSVLDKPGELTSKERALINKHPEYGIEILKNREDIPEAIKSMAFKHHEYLDGSGYPKGLTADQIEPAVRVMTIADIFAALTEDRAYRAGMPKRMAISVLRDMGPKLDQDLVREFSLMMLGSSGFEPRLPARRKALLRATSQTGDVTPGTAAV